VFKLSERVWKSAVPKNNVTPLRQRVALTQLYNDYARAHADPDAFLYPQQNQRILGEIFDGIPEKKESNAAGFFRHQAAVGNRHPLINSYTRGRPLLFLPVTGAPTWADTDSRCLERKREWTRGLQVNTVSNY
jgi:hypothetical protein